MNTRYTLRIQIVEVDDSGTLRNAVDSATVQIPHSDLAAAQRLMNHLWADADRQTREMTGATWEYVNPFPRRTGKPS